MFPSLAHVDAARQIHDQSSAVVLFTDGSKSVRVFGEGAQFHCDVPNVEVVDTVGAGDSFSGGFLSYWDARKWTRRDTQDVEKIRSAVQFGITVAAITCQRAGATPPFAHELG